VVFCQAEKRPQQFTEPRQPVQVFTHNHERTHLRRLAKSSRTLLAMSFCKASPQSLNLSACRPDSFIPIRVATKGRTLVLIWKQPPDSGLNLIERFCLTSSPRILANASRDRYRIKAQIPTNRNGPSSRRATLFMSSRVFSSAKSLTFRFRLLR